MKTKVQKSEAQYAFMDAIHTNNIINFENMDETYISKIKYFFELEDINALIQIISARIINKRFGEDSLCTRHHRYPISKLGYKKSCDNIDCEYEYINNGKVAIELLKLLRKILTNEIMDSYISMNGIYLGTPQHKLYYLNILQMLSDFPELIVKFKDTVDIDGTTYINCHIFSFLYSPFHNYMQTMIVDEYPRILTLFIENVSKYVQILNTIGYLMIIDTHDENFLNYYETDKIENLSEYLIIHIKISDDMKNIEYIEQYMDR